MKSSPRRELPSSSFFSFLFLAATAPFPKKKRIGVVGLLPADRWRAASEGERPQKEQEVTSSGERSSWPGRRRARRIRIMRPRRVILGSCRAGLKRAAAGRMRALYLIPGDARRGWGG